MTNRTPDEQAAITALKAFANGQANPKSLPSPRNAAQVILRRMEILEMLLTKAQNPLYVILVRIGSSIRSRWQFYANNGGLTLNEVDAVYFTRENAERQMAILKQACPDNYQFKIAKEGSW